MFKINLLKINYVYTSVNEPTKNVNREVVAQVFFNEKDNTLNIGKTKSNIKAAFSTDSNGNMIFFSESNMSRFELPIDINDLSVLDSLPENSDKLIKETPNKVFSRWIQDGLMIFELENKKNDFSIRFEVEPVKLKESLENIQTYTTLESFDSLADKYRSSETRSNTKQKSNYASKLF